MQIKSRHIPIEQITKELQEIENSLSDLEKAGIDLERKLRSCEEGRKRESRFLLLFILLPSRFTMFFFKEHLTQTMSFSFCGPL